MRKRKTVIHASVEERLENGTVNYAALEDRVLLGITELINTPGLSEKVVRNELRLKWGCSEELIDQLCPLNDPSRY